jgi:basic amino acid/polyamine antiporter, APA family
VAEVRSGEMKRTLGLTGVTVNAMALIAPGAFLWTTFQTQAALTHHGASTAPEMWTGLLFSLILAMLTAYSYAELARLYPDAGTGSSYYFAEAAFLDKERPQHQRYARAAKLSVGWISHLYYWIYPGIMVAFTATLFGYLYSALVHHTLTWLPLSLVAIAFAAIVGYIAYLGITGSTIVSVIINVIQITCLLAVSIVFLWFRFAHPHIAPPIDPATHMAVGPAYDNPSLWHILIPHNFVNMLYQSTVAILLLVGFESVTALGAEAKNPDKDIKKGVLLSLLIQGGVCYMFEYLAANYVIGSAVITNTDPSSNHLIGGIGAAANAKGTSAPIGDMIHNIAEVHFSHTGTTLAVIVALTVLLALIGTNLACVNTGVRITYTMGKDKEMPSILGWLHGKWATPHGGIIVMTVVAAALGAFGANPYQVDNLTQITLASNIGTFLVYGTTCVIALVAFASRHDRHPVKHLAIPGVGAVMNIVEMLAVLYIAFSEGTGTTPGNAEKALIVVALWIVLGFIWTMTNPNRHAARLAVADKRVPLPVGG